MRSEEEIIRRIIETSRKIGTIESEKRYYCDFPIEDTEKSKKKHEEKLLEYDFEINSLGTELNVFVWLFGKDKND